jgi:hypothetical protein
MPMPRPRDPRVNRLSGNRRKGLAILLTAANLRLRACAALHARGPPGCHGVRRTADPHGTILASGTPIVTTPTAVLPARGVSGCAVDGS